MPLRPPAAAAADAAIAAPPTAAAVAVGAEGVEVVATGLDDAPGCKGQRVVAGVVVARGIRGGEEGWMVLGKVSCLYKSSSFIYPILSNKR